MKGEVTVILVLVICCFGSSDAGLTLNGVKCGQVFCKIDFYCSEFDRICRPCADVCENNSHNYDETLCMKDCQDYIHDARYARKDGKGPGNENLKIEVQKLSHMVTASLTLVCLMLIVLAIVLSFQLYRWKIKKNITLSNFKNKLFPKKSEQTPEKSTTQIQQSNVKPDLHLDISSAASMADHSPVTTTTSISRRPAEDSALDYAYDNPAMSSSPTSTNKPESHSRY